MALMQQTWDYTFFFPCRQHALVHYLKYRCHAHTRTIGHRSTTTAQHTWFAHSRSIAPAGRFYCRCYWATVTK